MTCVSVNLAVTYLLSNKHVNRTVPQWINLLRLELENCQFNPKH